MSTPPPISSSAEPERERSPSWPIVGLPAILIPLPGARGDEQALNAQVLADAGAAVVIAQSDATPERLRTEILALLDDPERRARMAKAARTVARPDAAARVADELLSLAR